MNVLLTSAGRRTSLLQAFLQAVRPRGGTVGAGDMDALAPTLQVADYSVVLPPVDADGYLDTLLDVIAAHDVDLVVPCIDPELRPLAEAREALAEAGARALVSDAPLLDVTLDKWTTVQHFSAQGIRMPASWRPEDASWDTLPDPVFVKPRRGSASKGARAVTHDQLLRVLSGMDQPLLQEVIDAPEITVDALFNLEGTLLHYVPRLRVRTLAGESVQGRTLPDADWRDWLRPVLREVGTLGARGPVTLQAFATEPEPTLSEINARFGGGFPLARAAGGHYPKWLQQLCAGDPVAPRLGAYRDGLCMTRAYAEWFVPASALKDRFDAA